MAHGGARNRSGPQPDENSLKSGRIGYTLAALPAEGYQGDIPNFPLPALTAREAEVWQQAWRTPQAAAWSMEPWRWPTAAMWVRWSVRMEAPDASPAIGTLMIRLADQIGMTPAGLKENGWKIAADEVAGRRQDKRAAAKPSARGRLLVVQDAADGA